MKRNKVVMRQMDREGWEEVGKERERSRVLVKPNKSENNIEHPCVERRSGCQYTNGKQYTQILWSRYFQSYKEKTITTLLPPYVHMKTHHSPMTMLM